MLKHCFPGDLTVNKYPKQLYIFLVNMFIIKDKKSTIVYNLPQTKNIPSLQIFFNKPLLDVAIIEERIQAMILQIYP